MQQFIRELFVGFEPAPFHEKVAEFRWHAIATTNYDLVIDRAYGLHSSSIQQLVPFIKDEQQVEREAKRATHPLLFLKLHGCIDHINDPDVPLILTSDQYVTYAQHRRRLFDMLRGWAHEFPIIFCGYSLDDVNIRTVLFDLFNGDIRRPNYYIVLPRFDDIETRVWMQNRIVPIKATFEEFIWSLEGAISPAQRALSKHISGDKSSLARFLAVKDRQVSPDLQEFLTSDVVHVRSGMPISQVNAADYYKGYDTDFSAINDDLDVRRGVGETLLVDAVLEEENPSRDVELYLLRGAAGNGKTTTLKRVAWDAAVEFDALVFYQKEDGALRLDRLEEIYELTNRRIFLCVDRPALNVRELASCLKQAKKESYR